MSKENIIQKIISDSEARCNEILSEAHNKAEESVFAAKESARKKLIEAGVSVSSGLPELKRRSRSVAELEAKKLALGGRQEVLGYVFDRALAKLCALPDEEYLAIIRAMLLSAAESEDTVVIAKADSKRVTAAFIAQVADKAGIKLHVSKEYGDFLGGIILQSKNCDKNLSFEVELSALREELEPKLASMIF